MEERDLLPVRFGTLVPPTRGCDPGCGGAPRQSSPPRSIAFAARWSLRCGSSAQASERAGPRGQSGRAYMEAKARRICEAGLVHEPLAGIAQESLLRPGPELLRAPPTW